MNATTAAMPDTPAAGSCTPGNTVPPLSHTTPFIGLRNRPEVLSHADLIVKNIAEAESRRLTMQTEAAINMAVGLTLQSLGQTSITITPDALAKFSATYLVEQRANPNGGYTLTVVERPQ